MTDSIKIALLDKNGNILKVSDSVSVTPTGNDTYPNQVNYDASSTTPKVNFVPYYQGHTASSTVSPIISVAFSVAFLLLFLLRMAISIAIETLIAVPFKIKPLWKVIVVNIITQILLYAFVASGLLSYTNTVILGEILVYISEFVAYTLLFKQTSKRDMATRHKTG